MFSARTFFFPPRDLLRVIFRTEQGRRIVCSGDRLPKYDDASGNPLRERREARADTTTAVETAVGPRGGSNKSVSLSVEITSSPQIVTRVWSARSSRRGVHGTRSSCTSDGGGGGKHAPSNVLCKRKRIVRIVYCWWYYHRRVSNDEMLESFENITFETLPL